MTEILKINKQNPEPHKIKQAAEIIKQGGLVVFPTETVYGLGADVLNPEAVKKVFAAKGRPSDNPLIVHIADVRDVQLLAKRPPKTAMLLMERFWPGPLTIILKKRKAVPDIVTAGGKTVAIRMPDNKIALSLICKAGVPVIAPSANLSGRPSPTRARDVIEDLMGRVDLIIDGGDTMIGVESTVIDLTVSPPVILRPGGIAVEDIEAVIGDVRVIAKSDFLSGENHIKSPGLKYRHYAPQAEMVIVQGQIDAVQKKIEEMSKNALKNGKKVGIITFQKNVKYPKGCIVKYAGTYTRTIAKRLFMILRGIDKEGADLIISESLNGKGIGLAVLDRLKRASGYNVITV